MENADEKDKKELDEAIQEGSLETVEEDRKARQMFAAEHGEVSGL